MNAPGEKRTDRQSDPDQQFDALLRAMLAGRAAETKRKANRTSGAVRDEDCSDTQTPKDTSEDAS